MVRTSGVFGKTLRAQDSEAKASPHPSLTKEAKDVRDPEIVFSASLAAIVKNSTGQRRFLSHSLQVWGENMIDRNIRSTEK